MKKSKLILTAETMCKFTKTNDDKVMERVEVAIERMRDAANNGCKSQEFTIYTGGYGKHQYVFQNDSLDNEIGLKLLELGYRITTNTETSFFTRKIRTISYTVSWCKEDKKQCDCCKERRS